jgi:electron transport complex protein RnfG
MTTDTNKQAAPPSSIRLVLTLAIAGLISGIAIIGIYESTLPTITANKARELREAVFKVLPGVTRMQALVNRNGELVAVEAPDKDEPVIYGGYDETREFVGYAMPAAGPRAVRRPDWVTKFTRTPYGSQASTHCLSSLRLSP